MSTKDKKSVAFRLIDITTEQFALFKENFDDRVDHFGISLELNFKADNKNCIIGVLPKFIFLQQDKPVLVLQSGCHFQIDQDFWNENTKEGITVLEKSIATHLLVLAVGTARGIIHCKKPKWMGNALLPTMNISDFITEDIKFVHSIEEEE